ncbi:MAG TPA: transcriptional regulator [Polyangiaceae bacterium]|jgi:hypothetical protein|nr:transcriptional regulator [Polyangiaceae bacterium]
MASPRGYSSYQDFTRETLRPEMRIGWSTDELEHSGSEALDFDMDPFEAKMWEADEEDGE